MPDVPKEQPSQKAYHTILEQEITEGLRELERPFSGLFISGVSAGLDVSFSLFLIAVTMSLFQGQLGRPLQEVIAAAMYSVGFILVVLGRSELFTEHTTRAVYPILHGRASLHRLFRLWAIIYVANLIGSATFARLTASVGPAMGIIDLWALREISFRVVNHPGWVIFFSALLAGWLMGLLSWLVSAARDTTSQILLVGIITWTIGIAHLHHAVVGNVEVLAGIFARRGPGWDSYGHFLLWTTLGNAVGGAFFVALFKYSHVIRGGIEPAPVQLEKESPVIIDTSAG